MKANHAIFTAALVLLSLPFSCGESDADLPTSVQMLSTHYHEAYRLIPNGEWASQYYTLELDKFSKEEWETADDHTPTFIDSQAGTLRSDILFNLSKVIQDEDAEEWVVAKIHELVPLYGDRFEDTDLTSERIKLLKEIVAQGVVHQSILDVELYYRWSLLTTSDHPPEKVQLFVRNQRQFFETRQALIRLSQRDSMIRETELRICEFLMWDVVGVDNTLDVIANGECDVQKVIVLAKPGYTEAYNLIPEGSLMREYLDIKLGSYSEKGWELVKVQPDEPYPVPAPKLDARDELELRRVLTSAGDAEWLVQRLRSLDAGAAKQFEAAKEVTERLSVFRKLVEVEGKEQGVAEILAEWGARSNGWDEEEIAAHIERTRIWAAENEARSRMTPRQGYINHVEGTLCGDLMSHIVGQHPRTANSSPAQCDIAQVITLTKEALQGGQKASSDQQTREAIELARQNQGQ